MKHRFFEREHFPVHVSGKCTRAHWPTPTTEEAWAVFCESLDEIHEDYNLITHAFVLMDNHYHWLCTYDKHAEDPMIYEWFHEVCRLNFLHQHGCVAQAFESEPEVILLDNIMAYRNAYRYVYQNPLKAGLCKRAQDYPYSSLYHLMGGEGPKMEFHDNMHVIHDPCRTLSWLNDEMEYGKFGWESKLTKDWLH